MRWGGKGALTQIDKSATLGCNNDQTLFVAERERETFAMQAIGQYKKSEVGSALKERDHKDATDLVVIKR